MNSLPHLHLLHQSLLPLKPSLHSHHINPTTPTHITACAKTPSKTRRSRNNKNPDDYHSTLTALNSKGRFPRKSLGQHYMLDSEVNDQLVAAAGVCEGDVVLEIGPGTGSLTNVLIEAGATVLAIEKDPYMATLVSERFAQTGRLKVLQEDFVKCHIHSHMSALLRSLESSGEIPRHAKVNSAFNGKRKMLRKSLQHICSPSDIESALDNVGRPATSRPEELTTDDFVKLHNLIVTE